MKYVSVENEPDLYSNDPDAPSYFGDLIEVAKANGDPGGGLPATERLARHNKYEIEAAERRSQRATRSVAEHGFTRVEGVVSSRASSNIAGSAGQFLPPTYLTELFGNVSLAAAPLKSLVTRVELPEKTLEIHVPRFDVSAGITPQAAENTNSQDLYSTTDQVVAPVATLTGDVLLSQALYDRGGNFRDAILAKAMGEAYGANLESQLINGTGTSGQILGLLNVPTTAISPQVPGAQVVSYTASTAYPDAMLQSLARLMGQVSDARQRPATALLMRDRRLRWLSAYPTSANSINQPMGVGVLPEADTGPYGPVVGAPAFLDQTIPTTLGSGNQDTIIALRASDIILLEDSAPRFSAYVAGSVAGQLMVVVVYHRYVSAVTSLYPSAIGILVGSGMVVPS